MEFAFNSKPLVLYYKVVELAFAKKGSIECVISTEWKNLTQLMEPNFASFVGVRFLLAVEMTEWGEMADFSRILFPPLWTTPLSLFWCTFKKIVAIFLCFTIFPYEGIKSIL